GGGVQVGLLGAAVGLVRALGGGEARGGQPILPLGLLADRERAGAYAAIGVLAAVLFGFFFFMTTLLQTIYGYGPLKAGLAFLPTVGAQFLTVRLAPRLTQRYSPRVRMLV